MSKRGFQKFPRVPQDAYDTPARAILPLLEVLRPGTRFIEPCAGSGALVRALEAAGHHCVHARDIAPRGPGIEAGDGADIAGFDHHTPVITNPPYERKTVLRLMQSWIDQNRRVMLLLPLDWLCNLWFQPISWHMTEVAPIGRVKWIEDSANFSSENYIWAGFYERPDVGVVFHSRVSLEEEEAA